LNLALTIPLLILVIIGTFLSLRRKLLIVPLLAVVGGFMVVHLPVIAVARFHIPLVPLLAIPAALPVSWALLRKWPKAGLTIGASNPSE
jgi:hypothetical protein